MSALRKIFWLLRLLFVGGILTLSADALLPGGSDHANDPQTAIEEFDGNVEVKLAGSQDWGVIFEAVATPTAVATSHFCGEVEVVLHPPVGKYRDSEYDKQHGPEAHALAAPGFVHRGLGPDDILITLGGGDAGGHSCCIPSWSRQRSSLMQHKPIGVCIDCN